MRSIPAWFLTTAAIFALFGMAWGIQMSASQDHTLAPAHGHLNLIGFVTMSIFAFYYALTPSAAARGLARIHYLITTLAVLILTPGIVLAISGEQEFLAKIGSVLAVLSMALFVYTVLRDGVGRDDTKVNLG
ncbi:MAG: hypothetical protein ABJH63_20485 [Rhizobiaceae bacterium]